jgi:protein-disulfide isomerase
MSSRVQQKAAARRDRLALEDAARDAVRRRRSLVRLAAVAGAALALVGGAVAVSRIGGAQTPAASPGAAAARYAGLAQDGIALGAADAPATLVEFADLQCPYCAAYAGDVLPSVVDAYVRPGKLRLELNVLTFLGEDSVQAGRMAAAAALQDRLWPFADEFYGSQGVENSGYVTDDFLRTTAAAGGLDVSSALKGRDGAEAERVLAQAREEPLAWACSRRRPSSCAAATGT